MIYPPDSFSQVQQLQVYSKKAGHLLTLLYKTQPPDQYFKTMEPSFSLAAIEVLISSMQAFLPYFQNPSLLCSPCSRESNNIAKFIFLSNHYTLLAAS